MSDDSERTAIVLIDHQVGTMGWVRTTSVETMERNAAALAETAVALGAPVVLTSSMENAPQGPLFPKLEEIVPDAFAKRVQRAGIVNGWEDPDFSGAVRATDCKRLVMAGVTTDVCLAPPVIGAVREGYRVDAVIDASGSPTQLAEDLALRRMEQAGASLTTTIAVLSELARDWTSPAGDKLLQLVTGKLLPAELGTA